MADVGVDLELGILELASAVQSVHDAGAGDVIGGDVKSVDQLMQDDYLSWTELNTDVVEYNEAILSSDC